MYLALADPGMSANVQSLDQEAGAIVMASIAGEQLGFPAWSDDGTRMILAATGEPGNAVYVIDAQRQRVLGRYPVKPVVGPVQLSKDLRSAVLTEQRWASLVVHRLDLSTGKLQQLFEIAARWGQMSANGEVYYAVGKDLMLHEHRISVSGFKS